MSRISAKARLQCLQDWRRSMGIKTKDEKRPQKKNRRPKRGRFHKSGI